MSDVAHDNYWRGVLEGALEERERIIKLLKDELLWAIDGYDFNVDYVALERIIKGTTPESGKPVEPLKFDGTAWIPQGGNK